MNERVEEVDGLVAGKDGVVVGAVCGVDFGTLHGREGESGLAPRMLLWSENFYERLGRFGFTDLGLSAWCVVTM